MISSHGNFHGFLNAALERHRACARGNGSHAFAEDGLRQHGRGGGAVAGNVGGLGSNLAHHLRAHVLERILQIDFLRHRHAVFGDDGRAELLLDHCIATLRAQRDLYSVRQNVDAAQNCLT